MPVSLQTSLLHPWSYAKDPFNGWMKLDSYSVQVHPSIYTMWEENTNLGSIQYLSNIL